MHVSFIKKWAVVPVMVLVWLLALFYQSGIGSTYDVYGKAKVIVIILAVIYLCVSGVSRANILLALYVIVCGVFTEIAYGYDTFDYVWLYLLIPLIALLPVEKAAMNMVSLIYGILGMAVLVIYNYGSVFDGWNTNSIAMIAFFSFAVMIASFNEIRRWWIFALLALYYATYYYLTDVLESRSGFFFTIIMLLGVIGIIPMKKIMNIKKGLLILLLIPLIVAVCMV